MLFNDKQINNTVVKIKTNRVPDEGQIERPYIGEGYEELLLRTATAINLNHTSLFVAEKLYNAIPETFWNDEKIYEKRILNLFGDSGFLEKYLIKKLMNNEIMKKKFPDYSQRLYHIMHNMIFSIAKTNASSLWLRKIVYYSADATKNGVSENAEIDTYPAIFHGRLFSVGYDKDKLDSYKRDGNIKSPYLKDVIGEDKIFNYPLLDWMNKSKDILQYVAIIFWDLFTNEKYFTEKELETLGEETRKKQGEIMDEVKKKLDGYFDVIIGNPPYNLNDEETGEVRDSIYHLFCQAAEALNPKYVSFIIPSKWMYGKADGKGMNTKEGFVQSILSGNKLIYLELINGKLAFPSVTTGEVCIYTKNLLKDTGFEVVFKRENDVVRNVKLEDLVFANSLGLNLFRPQDSIIEKILKKVSKTLESDVGAKLDYKTGITYGNFNNDILEDGMGFKKSKEGKLQRPKIDYSLTKDSKYNMKVYLALGKNGRNLHRESDTGLNDGNSPLFHVWADPTIVTDFKDRNYNNDILVVYRTSSISKEKKFKDLIFILEKGAIAPGCIPIGESLTDNDHVKNLRKFLSTRFSEYLMSLTTVNQHITSDSFLFIPYMDFSQEWDDDKLNKFFELDDSEISRINNFDLDWSAAIQEEKKSESELNNGNS